MTRIIWVIILTDRKLKLRDIADNLKKSKKMYLSFASSFFYEKLLLIDPLELNET